MDPAVEKVSFSVLSQEDGKRYKVYCRPGDFPKLRVAKIRKTIAAAAQLRETDFDILHEGKVLLDEQLGGSFNLNEFALLQMRLRGKENLSGEHFQTSKASDFSIPSRFEELSSRQHPSMPSESAVRPAAHQFAHASDAYFAHLNEKDFTPQTKQNDQPSRTPFTDELVRRAYGNGASPQQKGISPAAVPYSHLNTEQRRLQKQLLREARAANIFGEASPPHIPDLSMDASYAAMTPKPSVMQPHSGHVEADEAFRSNAPDWNSRQRGEVRAGGRETREDAMKGHADPFVFDLHTNTIERRVDGQTSRLPGGTATNHSLQPQPFSFTGIVERKKSPRSSSPIRKDNVKAAVDQHNSLNPPRGTRPERREHLDQAQPTRSVVPETHPSAMKHTHDRAEVGAFMRLWEEDHAAWNREREQLLTALAALQGAPELHEAMSHELSNAVASASSYQSQVESLQRELAFIDTLKGKAEAESAKNLAQKDAAMIALQQLREPLSRIVGGDQQAKSLMAATLERATLLERIQSLEKSNAALQSKFDDEFQRRRKLHNALEELKGNIRVVVRLRPPLAHTDPMPLSAQAAFDNAIIDVDDARGIVSVQSALSGTKSFEFYRTLTPVMQQADVYEEVAPIVQSALDGINVCILAYGQTGSGKTYTILGESKLEIVTQQSGILPRALADLFGFLDKLDGDRDTFSVTCSMIELYNDNAFDLLAQAGRTRCDIRVGANDTNIVGVTEYSVRTAVEALTVLRHGTENRQVHETNQNPLSSRSHALFSVKLSLASRARPGQVTQSKLVFVDLAGSERVSKSHSTGDRLKEAQAINKSLSALGDVVCTLSRIQHNEARGTSDVHIPYRNSKLTLLLRDCIGGHAKTVLIACIAPNNFPHECNTAETLSTLTFASRVRTVRNNMGTTGKTPIDALPPNTDDSRPPSNPMSPGMTRTVPGPVAAAPPVVRAASLEYASPSTGRSKSMQARSPSATTPKTGRMRF